LYYGSKNARTERITVNKKETKKRVTEGGKEDRWRKGGKDINGEEDRGRKRERNKVESRVL
jgi:hypothetical protein